MRLEFCCFTLAGVLGPLAVAQTDIPFKPGLWESNITSTVSGMQIPPDMQARLAQMPPDAQERMRDMMGGAPRTTAVRSCMTKDQFDKWNDSLHQGKDKDEQCVHSNETKTATERSFDLTCNSPTAKSTGHVEMFVDSDEKGHGSIHMVRTALEGPQAMHPVTIDVKFDTHYVGSDCGDIKPGEGQPVKQ